MTICDLTQFYSPVSGGVKRYVAEKVRCLQAAGGYRHILVIPGEEDRVEDPAPGVRRYVLRSPMISRTTKYRMLLRLQAVERILERERPDVIESADPYQLGWRAVQVGDNLHIPVVGFYHSHFSEAYLRTTRKFLGEGPTEVLLSAVQRYVRRLYNRMSRTCVPSPALATTLAQWGVQNTVHMDLGVDETIFRPGAEEEARATRQELGLAPDARLLLYIGRLAAEKNTHTLFQAFPRIAEADPRTHLLIVGDGLQRPELHALRTACPGRVSWQQYCGDSRQLARLYRAAELFVHPGVQETFGLVTLESQACGTRVVGVRGSFMDRIVHAGLEQWAATNEPASLARAVLRALATPSSECERQTLATFIATRYGWTAVFQRLFDLYREVIAEYPHRRL